MEFFADWHTHSKYSDGKGTIPENAEAALAKGLSELAITDHGPANIGTGVKCCETYFEIIDEVRTISERYPGLTIKVGAEADITGSDGSIDIPSEVRDRLDILIVGLHPYVMPASLEGVWSVVGINQLAGISRGGRERARVSNTKALKEAVYRFDVDFISHPNLKMPVDISELSAACAACDTAIEINTGHHYDKEVLVRAAVKTGVDFVVCSDAHFPASVGELQEGAAVLERFAVSGERVLNAV
ncbi:PHP domain-containing protein [Phosphitispora fastidiosa]|uniref:PHP domain-containing protein n=1 Tax=Phosphitispora fastidiosa TaxID=2837202 RepID=UPI001E5CE62E|nr:PHP domain-containing protein [Phosphitispora fastidiosa]MBU7006266.1 putative hydrolase [Phosphitispora fastidiosa]